MYIDHWRGVVIINYYNEYKVSIVREFMFRAWIINNENNNGFISRQFNKFVRLESVDFLLSNHTAF